MPDQPLQIFNLDRVLNRLERIERNIICKPILDEIGLFVISQIQVRTAEGKDANERAFTPYTDKYRLFRAEKGLPTDRVDLFSSGSMMGSMTHDASDDEVKVFFMNTQDSSGVQNPLKAFALNEDRRFFALSAADQIEIERIFSEYIESVLER